MRVRPDGFRRPGYSRPLSEFPLPWTVLCHRYSETLSTHSQGLAFRAVPNRERATLRQDNLAAYRSGSIVESLVPLICVTPPAIVGRSSTPALAAACRYVAVACKRSRAPPQRGCPYVSPLPFLSRTAKSC